jgi:hypothetical protein
MKRQESIDALNEALQMIEVEAGGLAATGISLVSFINSRKPPPAKRGFMVDADTVNASVRKVKKVKGNVSTAPTPRVANAVAMAAAHAKQVPDTTSVNSPVTKVKEFLAGIQTEIQDEMDKDVAYNQELTTWCTDTKEQKDLAIKRGYDQEKQLMAMMESAAGNGAALEVEIAQLQKEVGEGTQTLKQAEELFTKEFDAAKLEEKELVEAIAQLKGAVTVLEKHSLNVGGIRNPDAEIANFANVAVIDNPAMVS